MANAINYSDLLLRDHQIYYSERLKPHDLELNVKLPSLTDIIISPYIIIKKIVQLTSERVTGKIEKLDAHSQITKHALHFVRSCLNVIQYLTWIGIFALEATTLSTTILTLTLCISALGIAKTAISLIRQQHFIYRLNFNPIDQVRRVRDDYSSFSSLEKIVPKQMHERFKSLSNDDDKKAFLDDLEHVLVMERLKKINEEFLTLSKQEKAEFEQLSVGPVKVIGLIQKKYVEKKQRLSERVHYTCSYDLCNELPALLNREDRNKAIELYNKIEKNSKLKRKILITNFFLYSVNIIISALSLSIQVPFISSIAAMGISTLISFLNHLDIYGKLDTTKESFDFLNCLPKWAKSIYEKIFSEEKTNPPQLANRVSA